MDLVVNASPLILLCKVGRVELLHRLCRTVCVPEGVVAEIEADSDDPTFHTLSDLVWLRRVAVSVPDGVKAWDLGRGESEVIAHALASPGLRPLLDDAEGKACALAFGLKPLGTGGLLVLAKRAGLLDSVGEVLDDMRVKGLWISEPVLHTILQQADEQNYTG
jgi:predicted nucleic acid-binding protein